MTSVSDLIRFTTGSLGDFVERHYETEKIRRMYLASNVYGMHAPPYRPGTAIGLMFHMLSGGDDEVQGFYGHVMGGMGSITAAMASAATGAGAEIRTNASVARIDTRGGRATGVVLEDGTEIAASTVVSNADPKRTYLGLVDAAELSEDFRDDIAAIKMAGPCAKVNFALSAEPRWTGMPADADPNRRSLATLVPTFEEAQRSVRPAPMGRDPRRALGRLRHGVQRRPDAGARRDARDDLVRAVRPVRAARRGLGLAPAGAGGQGGRAHRTVRARLRPARSRARTSSRRWTWSAPTA